MKAKYQKNQRVRFILAKDQHLHSKYPQFERYVNKTGTIVDSSWVGGSQPYDVGIEAPQVSSYHLYTVRLDEDGSEVMAVSEDALDIV